MVLWFRLLLFTFIYVLLLFTTAPSQAPQNVSVTAVDSTTLLVTWRPVPIEYLHGKLDKYIVKYRSETDSGYTDHEVRPPVENATLTGLRQQTEYSVQVLAFTVKAGVLSEAVNGSTKGIYVSLDQ